VLPDTWDVGWLRIHSMELKVGGYVRLLRVAERNPFNGIERARALSFAPSTIISISNPFNGIERGKPLYVEEISYYANLNPFNGIERRRM